MKQERLKGLVGGLALTSVILAGAWCLLINAEFFHDDTYIALRYVRNWLGGEGLTWNPGERVEGYSSPILGLRQQLVRCWLH